MARYDACCLMGTTFVPLSVAELVALKKAEEEAEEEEDIMDQASRLRIPQFQRWQNTLLLSSNSRWSSQIELGQHPRGVLAMLFSSSTDLTKFHFDNVPARSTQRLSSALVGCRGRACLCLGRVGSLRKFYHRIHRFHTTRHSVSELRKERVRGGIVTRCLNSSSVTEIDQSNALIKTSLPLLCSLCDGVLSS
jgi:hypothetical protein